MTDEPVRRVSTGQLTGNPQWVQDVKEAISCLFYGSDAWEYVEQRSHRIGNRPNETNVPSKLEHAIGIVTATVPQQPDDPHSTTCLQRDHRPRRFDVLAQHKCNVQHPNALRYEQHCAQVPRIRDAR